MPYILFKKYFWKLLIGAILIDLSLKGIANISLQKFESIQILKNWLRLDALFLTRIGHNQIDGFEGMIDAIASSWDGNSIINSVLWLMYKIREFFGWQIWDTNLDKYVVVFTTLMMIVIAVSLLFRRNNNGFLSKISVSIFALMTAGIIVNIFELYIFGQTTSFIVHSVQNNFLLGTIFGFIGFPSKGLMIDGYFNFSDLYLSFTQNICFLILLLYACLGFIRFIVPKNKNHRENLAHINNRYVPQHVKEEAAYIDQGKCRFCGSKEDLNFDHILPFSKGGTSKNVKNIQLLCRPCNKAKGANF